MSVTLEISGLRRTVAQMELLGKVPQKCVTKAAVKGAKLLQKEARAMAPIYRGPQKKNRQTGEIVVEIVVEPGALRKSIKLHGEKHRSAGKKVYEVTFDPKKNGILQKKIKHPGKYGGKRNIAYYPASQEYGFKTKGRKVEGAEFLSRTAEFSQSRAEAVMIEVFVKEIDREWNKR